MDLSILSVNHCKLIVYTANYKIVSTLFIFEYLYQASDGTAPCDTHVAQSPVLPQRSTAVAQLQVLVLFVI